MQALARCFVLLLLATAGLRAGDSLAHARQAQALLGPTFWSCVLRIENEARCSAYAPTLHALVFEFAGLLWFYTDANGTQSFSLHRDRLAEEKADFGPLLRDIEPGFTRWQVLPDLRGDETLRTAEALPNGCFIQSIVVGLELLARGVTTQARLLSFYHDTPEGRRGHTVLTYAVPHGIAVRDPTDTRGVQVFSPAFNADARALAAELENMPVSKACWMPLEMPDAFRGKPWAVVAALR